MADGQKCNIPLSGYGKGMPLRLRPPNIPMPYPPHEILRFYSSAMWSCKNQLHAHCDICWKIVHVNLSTIYHFTTITFESFMYIVPLKSNWKAVTGAV